MRERQYMLVQDWGDQAVLDQTKEDFVVPAWTQEFADALSMMTLGPGSPSTVLEQRSCNAEVHAALEQDSEPNLKKQKEDLTWEADHLEVFKAAGVPWRPPIDADPDLAHNVRHLPQRMKEIAYYQTHRARTVPDDVETFHDLNPTLRFNSCSIGTVMTIICSATIYAAKEKRLLHGAELYALQGYPLKCILFGGAKKISSRQATELAGNSFNGFAIVAILLGLLQSSEFPKLFKEAAEEPTDDEQTSSECSDSSTLDIAQTAPHATT